MAYIQVGILGKTGFGKSTLTRELIQPIKRKIIVDPHAQNEGYWYDCYDLNSFIEMIENKNQFSINCIFEDTEDYAKLFVLCWHLENFLLVIDEISIFAESFKIDETLLKIITRGRLKNISLLWNTQRPALINRTLTSQAYVLISFRLNDIRDLAYLNLDKDLKEKLVNLAKFDYVFIYGSKNELNDFFKKST